MQGPALNHQTFLYYFEKVFPFSQESLSSIPQVEEVEAFPGDLVTIKLGRLIAYRENEND